MQKAEQTNWGKTVFQNTHTCACIGDVEVCVAGHWLVYACVSWLSRTVVIPALSEIVKYTALV
jgi:hypothetical protein